MRRVGFGFALLAAAAVVAPIDGAPAPAPQQDLIAQARRLDLQGRQEDAIALYGQVLARTPASFDANYGIARALDLAGRYGEARRHFATAIDTAPDEDQKDQALRMMGVSYVFTGEVQRAAPYFEQVFDRRTAAGNFAGAAEVANELGRVYLEVGNLAAADEWYRRGYVVTAQQRDRSATDADLAEMRWAHALARIAARRGDVAEARRQQAVVKRLVDKPANADQAPQYAYLAGYVAFYWKNYDEAIAALKRADQQDPFILVLLAQAHERLGHANEARDDYQKVLASTSHAVNNAFARPIARARMR